MILPWLEPSKGFLLLWLNPQWACSYLLEGLSLCTEQSVSRSNEQNISEPGAKKKNLQTTLWSWVNNFFVQSFFFFPQSLWSILNQSVYNQQLLTLLCVNLNQSTYSGFFLPTIYCEFSFFFSSCVICCVYLFYCFIFFLNLFYCLSIPKCKQTLFSPTTGEIFIYNNIDEGHVDIFTS